MFRPDLLRAKRILITGGGTGLGASMAERLAGLGASLVLCGRRVDVLESTAARLSQAGAATVGVQHCARRVPQVRPRPRPRHRRARSRHRRGGAARHDDRGDIRQCLSVSGCCER
jgi:NAD(P)-dependent dehydrogenase (short-subunit alcohol dehydrogenase family)